MKPMLYMTSQGFAEVSGYRNGVEIEGYFIAYDNGKELEIANDTEFVNWTIKEHATYIATCRKNERINYEKYRCVIEHQELTKPKERVNVYEKNRRAVYATGNKWAIENWNATH